MYSVIFQLRCFVFSVITNDVATCTIYRLPRQVARSQLRHMGVVADTCAKQMNSTFTASKFFKQIQSKSAESKILFDILPATYQLPRSTIAIMGAIGVVVSVKPKSGPCLWLQLYLMYRRPFWICSNPTLRSTFVVLDTVNNVRLEYYQSFDA